MPSEPITFHGYVVVYGPSDPSSDGVCGTFARTAGGAWARFMPPSNLGAGEDAARRNRAVAKGYCLRRATMTIFPEGAPDAE